MKKIFSGIQPTNIIHIGNYLGALKNWVDLQNDGEAIYCIVDLHAITVPQDPKTLSEKILETAALFIACGVDPEKATLFVQSSRPEHSELAWILNCFVRMGELKRMTQYKAKIAKYRDNIIEKNLEMAGNVVEEILKAEKAHVTEEKLCRIAAEELFKSAENMAGYNMSVGLFDYPVLMAADILLYGATHVPVGEDQKQHIEITRDIAQRFDNKYSSSVQDGSSIFTVPEPIIKGSTARIMALDDPSKKMSKSSPNSASYIALTDDEQTIREKIKKAVTDSGSEIKSGADKPAITNLLNIFSGMSGREVSEIEQEFEGKGYGEFKEALAEAIINELQPIKQKFDSLMQDKDALRNILQSGAEKLAPQAQETLSKVKKAVGLGI